MPERWYRHGVVYCLDVDTFQDSDGDGVGDLPGLIDRLDYLARLGVTCIWLNPIHPSPEPRRRLRHHRLLRRPPAARLARRLRRADAPGRQPRHPGDHRPGRQPHLRRAPVVPGGPRRSRRRRTATGTCGRRREPPDRTQGMVFPGDQDETWTLRRAGRRVVLPPLLRLPARPQHGQPAGPAGDREDHRLLAAARRRRVPARRGAVRHRADRHPARPSRDRTSGGSTTSGRSCRGGAATR